MLSFRQVTLQGFRSWVEPATFQLDTPGLTQIVGKTGSGKSSIIEAVSWCLYGETLRDGVSIRSRNLPHKHGTTVKVELWVGSKDVVVTRNYKQYATEALGHKSSLQVVVDGIEWEVTNKTTTQADLIQLLGLTFTAFMRAVVIPQRGSSLLMDTPQKQRDALDAIFELDWLAKAKQKTEELIKPLTQEKAEQGSKLISMTHEAAALKTSLIMTEERNKEALQNHDNSIRGVKLDIEGVEKLLERLQSELNDLPEQIHLIDVPKPPYDELQQKNKEGNLLENELNNLAAGRTSLIKRLENQKKIDIEDTCGTCGGPLSEEQIGQLKAVKDQTINNIEASILQASENIFKYQQKASILLQECLILKNEVDNANDAFENYIEEQKKEQERQKLLGRIEAHTIDLERSNKKLKELQQTTLTLPDTRVMENRYNMMSLEIDQLTAANESLSKHIEALAWWSATGFGARGLRETVLQHLVKQVDQHLLKYTSSIGLVLHVAYSKNQLIVTVKDADNEEVKYGDLSGGEQQTLEMALTLALHDVLSNTQPVSILFLDEPMTNIDNEAVYEMFELLRQKANSVFIITHTLVDAVGLKIVEVEKDGKQSKFI